MTSILDVAKEANVSTGTVSNVYNQPQLVKEATREKVLSVAAALEYQPNLYARGLRSGQSSMVGILVPDITFPYTALVARGVMDVLKAAGNIPVVSNTDGDAETEIGALHELWRQGVSHFIVYPVQYRYSDATIACIEELREKGATVVFIGNQFDEIEGDVLTAEAQAGARMAVDHLVELGHQRIAFIGRQWATGFSRPRFLGYEEGMTMNKLVVDPALLQEMEEATLENGIEAFDQLFGLDKPPTAIVTTSDQLAFGVLNAAYTHGLRVPDELSIVGFNDVPMARLATPPLTTVAFPSYDIGAKSAELLLKRQASPDLAPQQIVMPCRLIVRGTTGPCA